MRRITTTCIGVALALTVGMATKAGAQPPACTTPGPANAGPFSIDGCITTTNNSGVAGALFTPDPVSGAEFGPTNGSTNQLGVINFAATPMLGDTTQPPKVNLTGVFTQAALSGTDFWFYFAWNRETTNGSGFLAVEFERAAKPTICSSSYGPPIDPVGILGCNPWKNRDGDGTPANSDFLILWDQTGSKIGPQNISVRYYNKSLGAFGPPQDVSGAGAAVALYGFNDSSKGELGINFSVVTGGGATQCLTFANIIPTTLTGNSDTADYKDTVLSNFPVASNCGTVTVQKLTVPAESPATSVFQYTLSDGQPMFGVPTPDADCTVTGSNLNTCIGELKHNETDTITNLLGGANYHLVENSIATNYNLTSIFCSTDGATAVDITAGGPFTVLATKTTACVITNSLQTGLLKIIKTVVPGFGLNDPPGSFSYTLDGTSAFFTQDKSQGGTTCTSGAVCRTETFNVGTSHTVVEPTPVTGYTVTYSSDLTGHSTDCTGLTISGTPVTCTVTNTATQATPAAVTRQRVLLFDKANIMGLRRFNTGETAMTVTFKVYGDSAACNAQTGALGSEEITIPPDQVAATSVTVGYTTITVEVKEDGAAGAPGATTARFWRALFHQAGTSPANADILTPCSEITTINFIQ
jgi:hypothetical protein